MHDRSGDPANHVLQKKIGEILSEAIAESRKDNSVDLPTPSTATPPHALWRGVGLILAIVSAWPAGLPKPFQALLFVAACSCTLVALIQYMRLPEKTKRHSPKSAKLHRIH